MRTPTLPLLAMASLFVAQGAAGQFFESPGPHALPRGNDITPLRDPPNRRCGNGRIDEYATNCRRSCESGSNNCERLCDTDTELCDGREMQDATCESIGFAGGTLRCNRQCNGYIVRQCDVCVETEDTSCAEANVPGRWEEASIELATNGEAALGLIRLSNESDGDMFIEHKYLVRIDVETASLGRLHRLPRSFYVDRPIATSAGFLFTGRIYTADGSQQQLWFVPSEGPLRPQMTAFWHVPGETFRLQATEDGGVFTASTTSYDVHAPVVAVGPSGQLNHRLSTEVVESPRQPASLLSRSGVASETRLSGDRRISLGIWPPIAQHTVLSARLYSEGEPVEERLPSFAWRITAAVGPR